MNKIHDSLPHPEPSLSASMAIGGRAQKSKGGSQKRHSYSIAKKLAAIEHLEAEFTKKTNDPMSNVAGVHNIAISTLHRWYKQRHQLKAMNKGAVKGKFLKTAHKIPLQGRRAAQERHRLPGGGRKPFFASIEQKIFQQIQQRRCQGTRTTTAWLRAKMLHEVRQVDVNCDFKASKKWLWKFLRRHRLCVRRKTNGKNLSIQERLPQIQQWHRNLRSRLRKGGGDPKWGLYPPEQRWNVDQVPYCLEGLSTRTIDNVNTNRVWVKGKKSGMKIQYDFS